MTQETTADSFFVQAGAEVIPTAFCRGPWDSGAAHGGPIAALAGRALEQHEAVEDLALVRVSLELLRPVPLARLSLETKTQRSGRRVQIVELTMRHKGEAVVHATGLRVKTAPSDLPDDLFQSNPPLDAPESLPATAPAERSEVDILKAVEIRAIRGHFTNPGPAACWFRVRKSLFPGEPIAPLTRVLIAADFGNGVSRVLDMKSHVFINPDLTVHLHRLPEGEWIANDARTWLAPGAGAYAEASLHDAHGRIGRAVQSLYIAHR